MLGLDELLKTGGYVGGEQSGHIIFPEISLAGDGMISALEILRVMVESKRSLSDLAASFVRYPQILLNVRVGEQTSASEALGNRDALRGIKVAWLQPGRHSPERPGALEPIAGVIGARFHLGIYGRPMASGYQRTQTQETRLSAEKHLSPRTQSIVSVSD